MKHWIETLVGATTAQEYSFSVYQFGAPPTPHIPTAYLQAGLHGTERPGVLVLHHLVQLLKGAEADGYLTGSITIVPQANPLAEAQSIFHSPEGRFDVGTRTNFNRSFPLIESCDEQSLLALRKKSEDLLVSPSDRLKARLLAMALPHEIILDLHCDDESLPYLYVPAPHWPNLADLAGSLSVSAVITGEDRSQGSFEDAAAHPGIIGGGSCGSSVATVELRGMKDVSRELAQQDATSLYRFLAGRGLIDDPTIVETTLWSSEASEITRVDLVRAPIAGTALYHVDPGEIVAKGQAVATVIGSAGDPETEIDVLAPQGGLILTRSGSPYKHAGSQLMKIIGSTDSATAKTGPLEN